MGGSSGGRESNRARSDGHYSRVRRSASTSGSRSRAPRPATCRALGQRNAPEVRRSRNQLPPSASETPLRLPQELNRALSYDYGQTDTDRKSVLQGRESCLSATPNRRGELYSLRVMRQANTAAVLSTPSICF